MKISAKKYAISLYEATLGLEEIQVKGIIKNFIKILAKNNSLSQAPQIFKEFEKYWNLKQNTCQITCTTAMPMDKDLEHQISGYFAKELKQKIILRNEINKNLVGGAIFNFGDTLIDASVKHQLIQLRNNLINN